MEIAKTTKLMVIWWAIFFSLNGLGSCITVAFINATWSDMGTAKRVLTAIAILTNWTGIMMAFFSKIAARLESGKPIIDAGGNTDYFTKTVEQQTITKKVEDVPSVVTKTLEVTEQQKTEPPIVK